MSLTVAQKTNGLGFPKAAELIEITGAQALDAADRAIQNLLFQHAHDSGNLTDPNADWELPLATIRKALSKHKDNNQVRISLAKLMDVQVRVSYLSVKTQEPRTLKTHLLEFIDISDGDAGTPTVQYGIPKSLRAVLARSNRWGRVKCEVTFAMTSKYAIALYEILCLRVNMKNCVESFTIAQFRELLGVPPGTYLRGLDFKLKVIDPAVLEVNGLSDFGVQIDLRRPHSRAGITDVVVAWWRKEGDEFRASMQELNRSKLGRMARLRGQVETLETV